MGDSPVDVNNGSSDGVQNSPPDRPDGRLPLVELFERDAPFFLGMWGPFLAVEAQDGFRIGCVLPPSNANPFWIAHQMISTLTARGKRLYEALVPLPTPRGVESGHNGFPCSLMVGHFNATIGFRVMCIGFRQLGHGVPAECGKLTEMVGFMEEHRQVFGHVSDAFVSLCRDAAGAPVAEDC